MSLKSPINCINVYPKKYKYSMKIEINGLDVIYKNGNHAVKNITLTIE